MKQTLLKNCLFIAITILAISCSNSFQLGEDGDKVIQTLSKAQFYRVDGDNGQEFSEVKLVREITAGDSLNFLLNNETVEPQSSQAVLALLFQSEKQNENEENPLRSTI